MKSRLWQGLVVVGLTFGPESVHAAEPEIVYYDVAGVSAEELRSQINTKGPIDEDGKRMGGYTHWYVQWTYHYEPAADGCRFTNLDVKVTATITLPRWAADGRAPAALVQKWQSYMTGLRLHEDGHLSHGLKAAEEITAYGQSLRTSKDCSTIATQFNDQAQSILEKYKAADDVYDAETQHGRTQGATLP